MIRKLMAGILIASQIGLGVAVASADMTAAPVAPTPESTLLTHAIAVQGENLPSAQLQDQMNALVKTYLSTAPAAGSQQRFAQALVDLGIYTPEQAQGFVADANVASAKFLSEMGSSATQAQALLVDEMTELAGLHPAGAQFSACNAGASDVAMTGLVTGLAGVGVTIAGAVSDHGDMTIGGVTMMGVGLIVELAAVIMNARC